MTQLEADTSRSGYFLFLVAVALAYISIIHPQFRYVVYAVPLIAFAFIAGRMEVVLPRESYPFCIILACGLLSLPWMAAEGASDLYFIFSGVCLLYVRMRTPPPIEVLVYGLFASLLLHLALGDVDIAARSFNLLSSESPLESVHGFLFPLLAIFCFASRRFALTIFCVVLSVLTLKRIALLGLLVGLAALAIGPKYGFRLLRPALMLPLNLIALFVTCMYATGVFDDLILSISGQSANQIGLGRQLLLNQVATSIIDDPAAFIFFGSGPGGIYSLSSAGAELIQKANAHSDILKLFYEYGGLTFVAAISTMYMSHSYTVRVLFLYLNILMLTDNTLIYSFFLVPFVICISALRSTRPD